MNSQPAVRGPETDRIELDLDTDRCCGHGRCYELEPGLFDVDDDGNGTIIEAVVDKSNLPAVLSAESACPERAISWSFHD